MRGEGIGPIPIVAPTPSILTTARSRTDNDFGVRAPLPDEVEPPEGALDPNKAPWRTGVSWVQVACAESAVLPQCPTGTDVELEDATPDSYGLVTSMPFWSYTPVECEWAVNSSEVDDAAAALTEARAAWHLSRAIWLGEGIGDSDLTGEFPQPTLRNSAQVAPGGETARPIEDAFALLQASYTNATDGLGGQTFHVPDPIIVYALGGGDGGYVCKPEGNYYRGPNGSVVSPGPGYPVGASSDGGDGFGPVLDPDVPTYTGNDEDEVWVYITGPVEYAMSKIVPLPVDRVYRRQNRHLAWAMRQLIFRFDPCAVFAALVESPVSFGVTS